MFNEIFTKPWAIGPSTFQELNVIQAAFRKMDAEEKDKLKAIAKTKAKPGYTVQDGTAIISIHGVITKADFGAWSAILGFTSSRKAGESLKAALDDSSVKRIVLDIDSPGGQVDGTAELANAIFQARGQKPITAYANGSMASAAYWIGAAADRVVVSSRVDRLGSIGVVAQHTDRSSIDPDAKSITEITAGKYKRIASENAPLSDEGRAYIQEQVDHIYRVFVDDVARFRGVSSSMVLDRMADGKTFIGDEALAAGLADEIGSLRDLVIPSDGGSHDQATTQAAPVSKPSHGNARAMEVLTIAMKATAKAMPQSKPAPAPKAAPKLEATAANVQKLRTAAGLTDAQLGERLNANGAFVQAIEQGRTRLDGKLFQEIKKACTSGPRKYSAAEIQAMRPFERVRAWRLNAGLSEDQLGSKISANGSYVKAIEAHRVWIDAALERDIRKACGA